MTERERKRKYKAKPSKKHFIAMSINTATKTATCFQNLLRAMYQHAQTLRMEKPSLTDKEIHEELFREFNPSKVNHEGLGDAEPFLPPYNTI